MERDWTFQIYNLRVMNKAESTHGIEIANAVLKIKYSGSYIYQKINRFFQADAPVFSPQAAKGDSRRIK